MLTAAALLLGVATSGYAAGHPDVTVITLGVSGVEKGAKERTFRLPEGPDGPWPQAIIFVSSQPWMEVRRPTPIISSEQPETERKQVPATIQFTVGGKALPPWKLDPHPTAYVLNLATIKTNPQYAKGLLVLTIDLKTDAPGLNLNAVGSPDPLLVSDHLDGPLSEFEAAAKENDVKAYFGALMLEYREKMPEAQAAYQKLVSSSNPRVARLARRGVRLLSYVLRPRRLSGNFNEHYRWGLYLQQCGLLSAASQEFDECRIADPNSFDAHFWTGQVADQLGAPGSTIFNHMLRAAAACQTRDPSDWYILVTILGNRAGKKLSSAEIVELKNHFLLAQGIIWGATHGAVQIVPTFLTIADEAEWPYRFRGDGVLGPSDEIVAQRGWFDGVFSVIPQVEGQAPIKVATVGGDEGPNGAAMSCLPHDAKWLDFLQAFYEQYAWAARVGESGVAFPEVDRARYVGHMPIGHRGYGYRSALALGFTDAMRRRPKVNDEPVPGSFVRLWTIEGPVAIHDASSANGAPKHHVNDPLPREGANSIQLESHTDYIDLAKLFPNAGPALARATSLVFSPLDQDVRMWLGQNDGVAVWVNGQCVHEGRYYSSGAYDDKNLVDTIASHAALKSGWNELRVVAEAWPAPHDKGWGFSVRFCNGRNQPLIGLAYQFNRPADGACEPAPVLKPGEYYSWEQVKSDYLEALPRFSAAELTAYTGIKGLSISSEVLGPAGYVALVAPDRKDSRTYRSLRSSWQAERDSDWLLNNVLDWARESCAALRYEKNGRVHDLLLIKPESVENFLTLLIEPQEAKALFKERVPKDRLLGYILVPAGLSPAPLVLADTYLGDEKDWPTDEEDLMNPVAPIYIPNKGIKVPASLQSQANP